jgi:hypothetical protein
MLLDIYFDLSLLSIVLYCTFIGLLGALIQYLSHPRYSTNIPDVGYGRGFWGYLKNNVGFFIHQKTWMLQGYEKVIPKRRRFSLALV